MTKQTPGVVDVLTPHLDHETVQTLRCWVLLQHIFGKEIDIKAPVFIARPPKREGVV